MNTIDKPQYYPYCDGRVAMYHTPDGDYLSADWYVWLSEDDGSVLAYQCADDIGVRNFATLAAAAAAFDIGDRFHYYSINSMG